MKLLWISSLIMLTLHFCNAQQVYRVPFASSRNTMELTIANSSSESASNVKVKSENVPSWMHISPSEQSIQNVKGKGEVTVAFTFDIDKSAPVNQQHGVSFTVTTETKEQWKKVVAIVIGPPDHFELYQNYPNPFNPTTVIGYLLPKESQVSLKIYNVLGQEVVTLVNELQDAGYKTANLDARNLTSGVYFYRIRTESFSDIKRMIVIK